MHAVPDMQLLYQHRHVILNGLLSDAEPRPAPAVLEALGDEASTSRVVGGLHYRFDADAGERIGRKAGGDVISPRAPDAAACAP